MNKVNWTLKVFEQKKTQNGNVVMRTVLSGKKNEDGTYEKGLPVSVLLNEKTEWVHEDLSGKVIDVIGGFSHAPWEKDGKSGFNFTVFADTITEHVWEKKSSGASW